jgi:hypothetical protein
MSSITMLEAPDLQLTLAVLALCQPVLHLLRLLGRWLCQNLPVQRVFSESMSSIMKSWVAVGY